MPKPGNPAVAPTALLLAEIERLNKADLIQAEGKIADLEARADVDPLLKIQPAWFRSRTGALACLM